MRYIHRDITAICNFIADHNFAITRLPLTEQDFSQTFTTQDIEYMLEKSENLWGTTLDYFFIVTSSISKEDLDIQKAVQYAESGKLNGFALVAYQDGGIISVSDKAYPFQIEAESAAWWYV